MTSELILRILKIVTPIIIIAFFIFTAKVAEKRAKEEAELRRQKAPAFTSNFRQPTASEIELAKEFLLPQKRSAIIIVNVMFVFMEVLCGGSILSQMDKEPLYKTICFGVLLLAFVMMHIVAALSTSRSYIAIRNEEFTVCETTIMEKKIVRGSKSCHYRIFVNEPDVGEGSYDLPQHAYRRVTEGDKIMIVRLDREEKVNSKRSDGRYIKCRHAVPLF